MKALKRNLQLLSLIMLLSQLLFGQIMNIENKDGSVLQLAVSDIEGITFELCKDADGNTYRTVKIGNQWWMAENLRTTHYRNGEAIPKVTDNTQWSTLTTGAYCAYGNDENKVATYGYLYNWYSAVDSRNIAPEGWHVPTDAEWEELAQYISTDNGGYTKYTFYWEKVGEHLKATSGWYKDRNGTDDYGFVGLPAGNRISTAQYQSPGIYLGLTQSGMFWSTTEYDPNQAKFRSLADWDDYFVNYFNKKGYGASIRCVKD
ncbi:MAG: fibrobacter succinogenes major paralogous domain-containing protein [Candidatus Marinimicrobia bacterium]|nr:fibrobacter succinogenes major paralogous domain-containing protein [Candidatus Neomarinimicrobiota bacterium]